MQLYRFSPIGKKEQLLEAILYVHTTSSELCRKVVGEVYPISSLTIFSHYFDEFEVLKSVQAQMGTLVGGVFGPRVVLHEPLVVGEHTITHLRIRAPDPYHSHVGSNDYDIAEYKTFKEKYLSTHPHNLRLIEREGYELIECWDPDFDVLGYVLSDPARSKR